MQGHEHSGDEADPSRSSRSRPRPLRARDEQVPERDDKESESRDGAHEDSREQIARSAWCGKHRRKAPPDMLTGRSVQACLSRDVPTDQEAHSQSSSGCRERERESRSARSLLHSGVEMTQFRREAPQRPKQNTRSTLVSTLRPSARAALSKTTTCAEAGHSSKPRAARE